jgi:chromosome segregation ATPase
MTYDRLEVQNQMNLMGRTQAQISGLTVRLQDLQREMAEREAAANVQLDALHEAIATRQADLASVQAQYARVKAEQAELAPVVQTLRGQMGSLHAEFDRYAQARQDVKAIQEELVCLKQSRPAMVQELEQLRVAIQSHGQTLEVVRRESGKAQKELEAKRNSLTQEHVALDDRWTVIKAAEAELAQRQSHAEGLLGNARRSKLLADKAQAVASEREQSAALARQELAEAHQKHQEALKTHVMSQEELQEGFTRLQGRLRKAAEVEERGKVATQELEGLKSALVNREGQLQAGERSLTERHVALVEKEQTLEAREQAMRQASLGMAQAQAEVRRLVQAYKLEQAGIVIPEMAPDGR